MVLTLFRSVLRCKTKSYPPRMMTTSIMIVFHNEAWSTLLRTVWSIIQCSPQAFQKILLVDGTSERDYLGEELERHVKTLPVPVLRTVERSGLLGTDCWGPRCLLVRSSPSSTPMWSARRGGWNPCRHASSRTGGTESSCTAGQEQRKIREMENSGLVKTKIQTKKQRKEKKSKQDSEESTYKTAVDIQVKEHSTDPKNISQVLTLPKSVQPESNKTIKRVYFDLETGGLETGTDILQIAAVCNTNIYSQYVTPINPVALSATYVTNLTNFNGVLTRIVSEDPFVTEPLASVPIKEALQSLLAWLTDVGPCLLIGHNINFDRRHIIFHLNNCHLKSKFTALVHGYADTLPLFRKLHPELSKSAGGPGHTQPILIKALQGEEYKAHDALADVEALKKLTEFEQVTDEDLLQYSISTEWLNQQEVKNAQTEKNLPSLQPFINSGDLSKNTAKKMAESGIRYQHLELAYKAGGFGRIQTLLCEDYNVLPKNTTNSSVVQKIVNHFKQLDKV